jgi:hypothetical protein
MREVAKRKDKGVEKVSDEKMGWDSCPWHANG